MTLVTAAKAYLYFMVVFQCGIGITALFAPELIGKKFDLVPRMVDGVKSIKAVAELRGLYGGGVLSWGLMTLAALRCETFAPGMLAALGLLMGCIAFGRLVSLIVDRETALNIPAGIAETLIALSCWVLYSSNTAA